MSEHKAGELAYLDTFSGLVPCKVLAVLESGDGHHCSGGRLMIRLTAGRGAYRKGEVLDERAFSVIPRSHARRNKINVDYCWVGAS